MNGNDEYLLSEEVVGNSPTSAEASETSNSTQTPRSGMSFFGTVDSSQGDTCGDDIEPVVFIDASTEADEIFDDHDQPCFGEVGGTRLVDDGHVLLLAPRPRSRIPTVLVEPGPRRTQATHNPFPSLDLGADVHFVAPLDDINSMAVWEGLTPWCFAEPDCSLDTIDTGANNGGDKPFWHGRI